MYASFKLAELHNKEQYEEITKIYFSLELIPSDARQIAIIGNALIKMNYLDDATTILLEGKSLHPKNFNILYLLASKFMATREFSDAIDILLQCISMHPEEWRLNVHLHDCYLEKQDLLEAHKYIELAFAQSKSETAIFERYVSSILRIGDAAKSLELISSYSGSINKKILIVKANALLRLGKVAELEELLPILEDACGAEYSFLLLKASYKKLVSEADEALEILVKLQNEGQKSFELYNNLSLVLLDLFDPEQAKINLSKALDLRPGDFSALWNYIAVSDDIHSCIEHLEKVHANISKLHRKFSIALRGCQAFNSGDTNLLNEFSEDELAHPLTRSFAWICEFAQNSQMFFNRKQFFDYCLSISDQTRTFYEFGVWKGQSFRYLSPNFSWGYGFDTFEGLPESWHSEPKGNYTAKGQVPVSDRSTFIKGKFEETLPHFFNESRGMAGLINFDADLYSSTITALRLSQSVIDDQTILVFDEFIVNETWEQDEYKALQEFCNEKGLNYEVLAVCFFTKQVAVKLIYK